MRQIGLEIRSFCQARTGRLEYGSESRILFKFELSLCAGGAATPVVHLGCRDAAPNASHAVVPGVPAPGWADGRAARGPGRGQAGDREGQRRGGRLGERTGGRQRSEWAGGQAAAGTRGRSDEKLSAGLRRAIGVPEIIQV
jgi:hypothetical protein